MSRAGLHIFIDRAVLDLDFGTGFINTNQTGAGPGHDISQCRVSAIFSPN